MVPISLQERHCCGRMESKVLNELEVHVQSFEMPCVGFIRSARRRQTNKDYMLMFCNL